MQLIINFIIMSDHLLLINLKWRSNISKIYTIAAYFAASLVAAYYPAFSAAFKAQSGAPGI